MSAYVIGLWNHKGGCAKSTTVVHISKLLSNEHGYDVCVIDTDRQANASMWLAGFDYKPDDDNFFESDKDGEIIDPDVYTKQDADGETIDELKDDYDFILLDCPPAFEVGRRFGNVDLWIVPFSGRLSVEGAIEVRDEIEQFKNGHDYKIYLLPAMIPPRIKASQENLMAAEAIRVPMLPIQLYYSDTVYRAEIDGVTCWEVPYGGRTKITAAYRALAKAILKIARHNGTVRA